MTQRTRLEHEIVKSLLAWDPDKWDALPYKARARLKLLKELPPDPVPESAKKFVRNR